MVDFKQIFGEELVKKLEEQQVLAVTIEKLEGAKLIQNNEGEFVPQAKFSEKVNGLNEQIKQLTEQLEQRAKDVEELEKKVSSGANASDELEKLKQKHSDETEALKKKLSQTELEAIIRVMLQEAQIKRSKWADHLIAEMMQHSDKFVKLPDGKYSGIEDLIKSYKESDDYKEWFGEIKINGNSSGNSDEKSNELLYEGRKASDLTFTDKLYLKKEDPEKYAKMFPG